MFENDYDNINHAELAQRFRSSAHWFYWIAALTFVTSIISLLGGGWRFFLSLEITQFIDGFALAASDSFGEATKIIAIVLDIFIAALFAGIGYLASKRQMWAYVAGMVLFLFDALLALVFFDIIGILVHGFVLFIMIRGFLAGREMMALERAMAASAQAPAPASSF